MSKYYTINDLKVRVSDHEPNYSMDRFRGKNDIEFYTRTIEGKILSVVSQINIYCEKNFLEPDVFSEIAKDFPDPKYKPSFEINKITVSQEMVDGYRDISGRNSTKRKEKYCASIGVSAYHMSQGLYIIK